MSITASTAAWKTGGLKPTTKLVLLKLADYAGADGRNAYPSVRRIAQECGVSRRTAQRALADLRRAGRISAANGRTTGGRRPTNYTIATAPHHATGTPGATQETPRGDNDGTPPAPAATPDPPSRSVRSTTRDAAAAPTPAAWAMEEAAFGRRPAGEKAHEIADYERRHGTAELQDAYDEATANGARGWPYVRAILDRWRAEDSREAADRPARNDAPPELQPQVDCASCGARIDLRETITYDHGHECKPCAMRGAIQELEEMCQARQEAKEAGDHDTTIATDWAQEAAEEIRAEIAAAIRYGAR